MNCRTEKRREEIIKDYDVIPVAHIKVLNGRIVKSDAGADISEHYYIFKCTNKTTKKEELVYCGQSVAEHFSKLLGNVKLPRIFNPLLDVQEDDIDKTIKDYKAKFTKKGNQSWNPLRMQLYNAVMLLMVYLENNPNRILFEIKAELETYVTYKPFFKRIKAVNTLYRKYGLTARKIINQLQIENNLKQYSFDLIVNELQNQGIEQYFEN